MEDKVNNTESKTSKEADEIVNGHETKAITQEEVNENEKNEKNETEIKDTIEKDTIEKDTEKNSTEGLIKGSSEIKIYTKKDQLKLEEIETNNEELDLASKIIQNYDIMINNPLFDVSFQQKLKKMRALRSTKLTSLLDKALEKCLLSFNYKRVAEAFPELAKKEGEILKNAYQQAVNVWKSGCKEDFQRIIEKYQLINKLNEFDYEIQKEVIKRKFHSEVLNNTQENSSLEDLCSITPNQLLEAKKIKLMKLELNQLKLERKKIEEENQTLYNSIEFKNQSVKQIMEDSMEVMTDVNKVFMFQKNH
ncbi:hypothetical protein K502DRAFT_343207 [Neoconidiobolus thromboides FSU 785]|nr:hypothetical protein K502DRAFT_343207 [Neoconidiobolus thromboides FSU 785]